MELLGGGERFAFQFLIGRLDTHSFFVLCLFAPKFQFLIGRLDTQSSTCAVAGVETVSIPHR